MFLPKLTHKGRHKEKISAMYYLWMVDNERGRGGGGGGGLLVKKKNVRQKLYLTLSLITITSRCLHFIGYRLRLNMFTSAICMRIRHKKIIKQY